MRKLSEQYGVHFHVPSLKYCTDNAAMIGAAAYPLFQKKIFSDLSLNASSSVDIKKYVEQLKEYLD